MKPESERHTHWQKIIEDQAQSGLSRREFCERNQIVLSQFSYYYVAFKKKQQKDLAGPSDVIPIHLRLEPGSATGHEIKVLLPNGLQVLLPCKDQDQLKQWLEVLRSC